MQAFLPGKTACSVVVVEHDDACVSAQMQMLSHTTTHRTHTHSKARDVRPFEHVLVVRRYSARCKHKSSGCANCASAEKGCAGNGQCRWAGCASLMRRASFMPRACVSFPVSCAFHRFVFSQGRAGAGEFAHVLTGHLLVLGLAPCTRDPLPHLQRR